MQAAILVEPKRIELRDVEVPQPAPGAVLVRVRAALTDGTDLKAYRRGHPHMPMPTRFGHEFSGEVEAVGEGVTAFAPGDAIMLVHSAPCLRCFWCVQGEEELCASVMRTKILGAYAQYIEVPAHIVAVNAFRKPASLSFVAAAFLEPLACVVHSVDFLNPIAGQSVAVIGNGGFGILHAMLLAKRGARVILAGRRGERMAIAQNAGVHSTIDARGPDLAGTIRSLTEGRGADAVIECTGQQEVWEACAGFVRRGGTASFFGGLPSDARVTFTAARMHYDQVRLISPFHFRPSSVKRAFDLLALREIEPLPLVTDTLPLARIGEVFERLDKGEGIKFAIEP